MATKILLDFFTEELILQRNEEAAKKMSAYMKDLFPFYGVSAPLRKDMISRLWQTEKKLIHQEIRPLTTALWKMEKREYQMIALDLLGRTKKQFANEDLPFIEALITTKSWWDTVDFLASTMIGEILKSEGKLARIKALEYMSNTNMWLQRTALIFQLKYKDQTNIDLIYELIRQTEGSKEFFINKASGWALRQYSKFNPKSVSDFIDSNRTHLASLTIREGSKYL